MQITEIIEINFKDATYVKSHFDGITPSLQIVDANGSVHMISFKKKDDDSEAANKAASKQ